MGMVPPLPLLPVRGRVDRNKSHALDMPYRQASDDDPYVPRVMYYDVSVGQYREIKHELPPPDAIPWWKGAGRTAVISSWKDSEGNIYEPPEYEDMLFAPADWQKEGISS